MRLAPVWMPDASFLTTTGLDREIVEFAQRENMLIIPGAPHTHGSHAGEESRSPFRQNFPVLERRRALPIFVRFGTPFPTWRLIASGGVTQQSAADYIRAGADVLGIGHELLPSDAVRARNSDWIQELARRFLEMVKRGRNGKSTNLAASLSRFHASSQRQW